MRFAVCDSQPIRTVCGSEQKPAAGSNVPAPTSIMTSHERCRRVIIGAVSHPWPSLHPRESGGPGEGVNTAVLDCRIRGNDEGTLAPEPSRLLQRFEIGDDVITLGLILDAREDHLGPRDGRPRVGEIFVESRLVPGMVELFHGLGVIEVL